MAGTPDWRVVVGGMLLKYLPSALIFFTAAAGTRLVLQHTIDTRYQILIFWVFAIAIEVVLAAKGRGYDLRRVLTNGCAVTIAMVTVRLILEGVPEKFTSLISLVI